MKIALGADDNYPIVQTIHKLLQAADHEVYVCTSRGLKHSRHLAHSCISELRQDSINEHLPCLSWPQVGLAVAQAVSQKICDEGIALCWSGTGVCIAANKIKSIRAALCTDAQSAKAARVWNHANLLALSSRLLSEDLAKEILESWFSAFDKNLGAKDLADLEAFESDIHAK